MFYIINVPKLRRIDLKNKSDWSDLQPDSFDWVPPLSLFINPPTTKLYYAFFSWCVSVANNPFAVKFDWLGSSRVKQIIKINNKIKQLKFI